jgi:hypothetical protein
MTPDYSTGSLMPSAFSFCCRLCRCIPSSRAAFEMFPWQSSSFAAM